MMRNRRGQGNVFSGDVPAIIMIVLSIAFFLSSIYLAIDHFESSKRRINVEAALVDASSVFLRENAKIRPSDLVEDPEFWQLKMSKIETSKGVQVFVELDSLSDDAPGHWEVGGLPPENAQQLTKRFPIALRSGETDLDVYPALVTVTVYTP